MLLSVDDDLDVFVPFHPLTKAVLIFFNLMKYVMPAQHYFTFELGECVKNLFQGLVNPSQLKWSFRKSVKLFYRKIFFLYFGVFLGEIFEVMKLLDKKMELLKSFPLLKF